MAARTDPLADPELAIRRVYAYVAYRIGDGAIAEDVTSATIERALRYRSSYNPRKGEPIAWLLGIARRELETGYREVANATEVRVEEDQGRVESFDDAVLGRVSAGQLVGKLPPRDRELLALRFGADLSARQIAKEIGMKPNAVEVAIHRALERLRDVVSPKVAVPASAVIDLDPAPEPSTVIAVPEAASETAPEIVVDLEESREREPEQSPEREREQSPEREREREPEQSPERGPASPDPAVRWWEEPFVLPVVAAPLVEEPAVAPKPDDRVDPDSSIAAAVAPTAEWDPRIDAGSAAAEGGTSAGTAVDLELARVRRDGPSEAVAGSAAGGSDPEIADAPLEQDASPVEPTIEPDLPAPLADAAPPSRDDLVARWSSLTRSADPEAPASELARRWSNLARGSAPPPATPPSPSENDEPV